MNQRYPFVLILSLIEFSPSLLITLVLTLMFQNEGLLVTIQALYLNEKVVCSLFCFLSHT